MDAQQQTRLDWVDDTLRGLRRDIESTGRLQGHLPYVMCSLTIVGDIRGQVARSNYPKAGALREQLQRVEDTLSDLKSAIEATGLLREHMPRISMSLMAIGALKDTDSHSHDKKHSIGETQAPSCRPCLETRHL